MPFGGQHRQLDANQTYLVFLFKDPHLDALQFAFELFAPGTRQHAPSQTSGNEGVEVWYDGSAPDDRFTLVGIVRTGASQEVVDEPRRRFARSWHNRRSTALRGHPMAWGTANNITYGQNQPNFSELWGIPPGSANSVAQMARLEWVQWADEPMIVNCLTQMATNGASQGAAHILGVGLDRVNGIESPINFQYNIWPGYRFMTGTRTVISASEGYHFLAPLYMSWSDFMVVYPISQQDSARFRLEGLLEGGRL